MKLKLLNLLSLFLILFMFTETEASTSVILSNEQLREMFPDPNLRSAVVKCIEPEAITLDNIHSINGELDLSFEKISNLKGISNLQSVESLILCNNNIKYIPDEILELDNLKSINIESNYITTSSTLDKLRDEDVEVRDNFNFISQKPFQYNLDSKHNKLEIRTGENFDLRKTLVKYIDIENEFFEVVNNLPKDLQLNIQVENTNIISLDESTIIGINTGTTEVVISIDDLDGIKSKTTIIINVL